MDYVAVQDARNMAGLRLALTAGVPAPYSMSARAILDYKGVDYVPVLQVGAGDNPELLAWTGHRNAPVAIYEDEAARTGWLEILNLAERLGRGDALLPEDINHRMQMVALTNELIGEGGWVWQMRLLMLGLGGPEQAAAAAQKNPMYAQYGYSQASHELARNRALDRIETFADYAREQLANSRYLIGNALSALDIYWVYFSQIMQTLPEEVCPMPRGLRQSYDLGSAACGVVVPELIEQRDWILAEYRLPMDF